jgi:hypothetical protein
MRCEEWKVVDGVTVSKRELPSDPAGAVDVHLDEKSEFFGFPGLGKLYGASYDFATTASTPIRITNTGSAARRWPPMCSSTCRSSKHTKKSVSPWR